MQEGLCPFAFEDLLGQVLTHLYQRFRHSQSHHMQNRGETYWSMMFSLSLSGKSDSNGGTSLGSISKL